MKIAELKKKLSESEKSEPAKKVPKSKKDTEKLLNAKDKEIKDLKETIDQLATDIQRMKDSQERAQMDSSAMSVVSEQSSLNLSSLEDGDTNSQTYIYFRKSIFHFLL